MSIHLILIPIYLAVRIKQNVVTPRVRAHESYLLRRELELEFNINNKFYTEKIYLFSLFRRRQGNYFKMTKIISRGIFDSIFFGSFWDNSFSNPILDVFQMTKSLFYSNWSWFQSSPDYVLLRLLFNFRRSNRTIFLWFKRKINIIMWNILFDTFEIYLRSFPMAIPTFDSKCTALDYSYCFNCYSATDSQKLLQRIPSKIYYFSL